MWSYNLTARNNIEFFDVLNENKTAESEYIVLHPRSYSRLRKYPRRSARAKIF